MPPTDASGAPVVRRDRRSVLRAHDAFLDTGTLAPGLDPLVAASWSRSRRSGVDPDSVTVHDALAAADLDAYRSAHPLAGIMPIVRELVVDGARDDGLVVAVCDGAGRLLWVEGDPRTRRVGEQIGFVPGAVWREQDVGTNAPGTALATRRAVQVLGAEHYARTVQTLNCAAAPIHDRDGNVLGVLDVTGGRAAGSHVALSLVRAAVAGIERELTRTVPGHAAVATVVSRPPTVALLGTPVLRLPAGTHRLSGRHAEILALLGAHPRGLTADELAVLLHPGDLSDVAVRAEVSRLRRVAGDVVTGSRPYRLASGLRSDVDAVRDRIARGDARGAVAAYTGPLLPRSHAPGVERARADLVADLRAAVLGTDDADTLEAWTRTDDGADDVEAWRRLVRATTPGSPRWHHARAHLAVVDAALR